MRRFTWTLLSQNAQVAASRRAADARASWSTPGRGTASSAAAATRIVREALIQVLGVDWKVEAIVDPSTAPTESRAPAPPPAPPRLPPAPSGRAAAEAAVAAAGGRGDRRSPRSSRPPRRADDEDADDGDAHPPGPAGPRARRQGHRGVRRELSTAHRGTAPARLDRRTARGTTPGPSPGLPQPCSRARERAETRVPTQATGPTSIGPRPGADLSSLMAQAQQMQQQAARRPGGAGPRPRSPARAGGGLVPATVTGAGELIGLEHRPERDRPGRPGGPGRPRAGGDPGRATARRPSCSSRAMGPLAEGLGGVGARRPRPARGSRSRRMYEGVVQDLIDELGRLPGVGPKSAQRIAFHLLAADPADVRRLVTALTEVKDKVRFCTHLRQRRRAGGVPDLPRPAPRPVHHLRGRGAQGRRRDREDPRVPRPLPRARRRDQPDRGHRPRRPAGPRADDPAGRRRRSPS